MNKHPHASYDLNHFKTNTLVNPVSPLYSNLEKSTPATEGLLPSQSVEVEGSDSYDYNRAIQRTIAWVCAAIAFGGGVWLTSGSTAGEEFFAGYLVEQSLSVDNLFVFLALFEFFQIPVGAQDRILSWGILGAIVMRAVMIGAGAAALSQFHAVLLVFAGILIYGSAQFFLGGKEEEEEDLDQNPIVKLTQKFMESTDKFDGDRFFLVEDGVKKATPMLICLFAVEISDVVFAVDSIPAVFGVTEVTFAACNKRVSNDFSRIR